MILCGGLGTRLRGAVADRAKPMADIDGRPFLQLLIDALASQGFYRFVLCAGHMADSVRAHFRDPRRFAISEEKGPLGTAGALRLALPLFRSRVLLVLNGDSLCPLKARELLRVHAERSAQATIAVAQARGRRDGGAVEFDKGWKVTSFREKAAIGAWINAGVYALERAVVENVPADVSCSLEREIFPAMIGRGLSVYPCDCALYDIGTPERLEEFREAWRSGLRDCR